MIDLKDQVFGRLTVVSRAAAANAFGYAVASVEMKRWSKGPTCGQATHILRLPAA